MSPTTFPAAWLPFPSFCLWALVKYCQWAGFSSWVLAKYRQHIPSEAPDNTWCSMVSHMLQSLPHAKMLKGSCHLQFRMATHTHKLVYTRLSCVISTTHHKQSAVLSPQHIFACTQPDLASSSDASHQQTHDIMICVCGSFVLCNLHEMMNAQSEPQEFRCATLALRLRGLVPYLLYLPTYPPRIQKEKYRGRKESETGRDSVHFGPKTDHMNRNEQRNRQSISSPPPFPHTITAPLRHPQLSWNSRRGSPWWAPPAWHNFAAIAQWESMTQWQSLRSLLLFWTFLILTVCQVLWTSYDIGCLGQILLVANVDDITCFKGAGCRHPLLRALLPHTNDTNI